MNNKHLLTRKDLNDIIQGSKLASFSYLNIREWRTF